jgi:hypothetical protein
MEDRRALSVMGTLDRDQYIASLRVMYDVAGDPSVESFRILAWNDFGRVDLIDIHGTLREGGEYERAFAGVWMTEGDHVVRFEYFDVAETDRALARFAELCDERQPAVA